MTYSEPKALSVLIVRPDQMRSDIDDPLFWKFIQNKLELSCVSSSSITVSALKKEGLNKKHDLVILLLQQEDLEIVPMYCICNSVSFVCVCLDFFPLKQIKPLCRIFNNVEWYSLNRFLN